MNLKLPAALLALGLLTLGIHSYLRYEQRVELSRFQSGFTEGLRLGALQEHKKLIGEMDCFGMVEEVGGHGRALLCSLPIENGAVALGSDLEQ